MIHALWSCPEIAQVWRSNQEFNSQNARLLTKVPDLILHAQTEGKNLEKMAMLLWSIWFRRNQVRVKNVYYPISQVSANAEQVLKESKKANQVAMAVATTLVQSEGRWSPPPLNFGNFDGAMFKDIGKAGIGVVIRDSQGNAAGSLSEQVQMPFSSDATEALAAARAISLAQEIRCLQVILEGDSEVIIKILCSEASSFFPIGHLLESANATIDTNCISFSHISHVGNSIAHNQAKYVSGYTV